MNKPCSLSASLLSSKAPGVRSSLGVLGLLVLAVAAPLAGCTDARDDEASSADQLRGINKREALAELAQIGDALQAHYGPLEYKKERFGFELDEALASAKAEIEAGSTEADFVRPVYRLLSKLHDGHVSYQYPMLGDRSSSFRLPFVVAPFGGEYAVTRLLAPAADLPGLAAGDVLVSIDGHDTSELEREALAFVGNGAPESEKHYAGLAMTVRPFYTPPHLAPLGPTASVTVRHADGSEATMELSWRSTPGGLAGGVLPTAPAAKTQSPMAYADGLAWVLAQRGEGDAVRSPEATVLDQGALTPYYLTPEVRSSLGIVEVAPAAETLAAFGVTLPETEATAAAAARTIQLHAYKYRFEGKTVLLVRIPTYALANGAYGQNHAWLAALLQENMRPPVKAASLESSPADVVVLDDSHNPGGSIGFGTGIVSLFTSTPIPNVVQAHRADRRWIDEYSRYLGMLGELPPELVQPIGVALTERRAAIEAAHDANRWLAPFQPFGLTERGPSVPPSAEGLVGENLLAPHPQVSWTKPVLVLIDELAGSCADIVPMLLKEGGIAKTFGTRTMGLGGNVEEVLKLPFSRAELRLTRGLFGAYKADPDAIRLIENNGVTPDYPYAHTVTDFRAGYVGYATAFSKAAVRVSR